MHKLFTLGRILWAVAMISLGLELFIKGNFPTALMPFPADFPGRYGLLLTIGLILIVGGLCIGFQRKADAATLGLGILFLLLALSLHLPPLLRDIHNGSAWTVLGELVAFGGGAFYVSEWFKPTWISAHKSVFNRVAVGRFLFAGSLVIFGLLHFIYADYIATLIPAWIPAPLFWAYFVGVAFLAVTISLFLNRQRSLSTGLLGTMFLLWVVLLHAPRVLKNHYIEAEWTSLLVALTMSGLAFMIAGLDDRELTIS